MNCKRCDTPLTGKQTSYCSAYCSKLHLKSLYRKRHPEKYKQWREAYLGRNGEAVVTSARRASIIAQRGAKCYRCEATDNLNIHHIKPIRYGGTDDGWNLMVLCGLCHQQLHQAYDHGYYWGDAKVQ